MHSLYIFYIILYLIKTVINLDNQRKIKAEIFDLDGTLIDSQKLYDEINQLIINEYGNGKVYDMESKLINHGAPPSIGNKYLIEHFEIKLSFEDLIKKKDEYLKKKINFVYLWKGQKK